MKDVTTKHLALLVVVLLSAYALVTLFGPHEPGDESNYVTYAENLADGSYSGRGADVDLWFGPGLPLLITPLALLDVPLEVMRLLGAILLTVAVVVFYAVLRLTVTPVAALLGALALGLYWPLLPLLPTLHSEIPAVLAVVAFMLAMTLDLAQPRLPALFGASACLALLAVTRVVFGWVLVVVLVVALVGHVVFRSPETRRLALTTALALVLATPWLLYTYEVTGKPFYWATSGGMSLYWMSSPYPEDQGDWHSTDDVFSNLQLAPHRPLFERLAGLNQVELDESLTHEAIRNIRRHPFDYLTNVAANVSRLWFSTPFSHTPQKLSTTFYIVPNAFLLTGLIVAMVLLGRMRPRPPGVAAFATLLLVGVAVQALLAGYVRMLAPLVPLILWFIVQAIASQADLRRADAPSASDARA